MKTQRYIDNIEIAQFEGVGKYEFPQVLPCKSIPQGLMWDQCSHLAQIKDRIHTGLHFNIFDTQIQPYWSKPTKYAKILRQFGAVASPDFSMYADMPEAYRIWSVYKNRWLGRFWQECGITVVPLVSWSTPDSFDWMFDGYPTDSIVMVSSVGSNKDEKSQYYFRIGYRHMIDCLNPIKILYYGVIVDGADYGNIEKVDSWQEHFRASRWN